MFEKIKSFFLNENLGVIWLFVSLILLIFVDYPLSGAGIIDSNVSNVFVSVLLILALISINVFRDKKSSMIIFGMFVILIIIADEITDNIYFNFLHQAGKAVFFSIVIYIVLRTIFRSNKITKYTVIGSIVVYMMFGLICASAYYLCFSYIPNSFYFNIDLGNVKDFPTQFVYYSFTTLTTLGLGDITPTSSITRSISIFEALIGQLYPVVLIGSIISMRVERKSSEMYSPEKKSVKEEKHSEIK